MSVETISEQKQVTAVKEHRCNFCNEKIRKGEKYTTSTHKYDGEIYSWKTHNSCQKIASRLNMYRECYDEGLTQEHFQETIREEYMDIMRLMMTIEDRKKYSEIFAQLDGVYFYHKLRYVIHHYAKLDKLKEDGRSN